MTVSPFGYCSCHGQRLVSSTCVWCFRPAVPVKGTYLERLYPGRTTCTGCGRVQLHCSCERLVMDLRRVA